MNVMLGKDLLPYRILGASNVIVREEAPGRVVVGLLDPQIMVDLVGKTEVKAVADAAEQHLRRACESQGGSAAQAT